MTASAHDALIQQAKAVAQHAYAPYSGFKVGAAIQTASGAIFVGCNVENASYPAGVCAERGAIAAMVAQGHTDPVTVAVFTDTDAPNTPCGMCRQALSEFAKELLVLCAAREEVRRFTIGELLPHSFELS